MFDTDNLTAAMIVTMVANFLISTCRTHKAIKLCQEGLSLVSKLEIIKQNELYKNLNKAMHLTLLRASFVMDDCTNVMKYTKEYLHIQQECGEMAEECRIDEHVTSYFVFPSK